MALITALIISAASGRPVADPAPARGCSTAARRSARTRRSGTAPRRARRRWAAIVILTRDRSPRRSLWANLTQPLRVGGDAGDRLGFGLIGIWDDMTKLRTRKGSPRGVKFSARSSCWPLRRAAARLLAAARRPGCPVLAIPFLKGWLFNLGLALDPLRCWSSSALRTPSNLTDGLDGLGDRPGHHGGRRVRGDRVPDGQLPGRRLSQDPQRARGGRADGILRRADRRRDRLSLVQLPIRPRSSWGDAGSLALGGRHRHAGGAHQGRVAAAARSAGSTWSRRALGHHPGRELQAHRARRVFRMAPLHHHYELLGLGRAEDRRSASGSSRSPCALLALTTLKLR